VRVSQRGKVAHRPTLDGLPPPLLFFCGVISGSGTEPPFSMEDRYSPALFTFVVYDIVSCFLFHD